MNTGANAAGLSAIESALRARNVRATFFLTGTWVHDFPAQANLIVQDGYLVGNHSVPSRSWSPATWSTCAPATSWWLTAWCGASAGLEADESLLTGESEPVGKRVEACYRS